MKELVLYLSLLCLRAFASLRLIEAMNHRASQMLISLNLASFFFAV
jgi:hypothetical protein